MREGGEGETPGLDLRLRKGFRKAFLTFRRKPIGEVGARQPQIMGGTIGGIRTYGVGCKVCGVVRKREGLGGTLV